jgi:hypothetical protein
MAKLNNSIIYSGPSLIDGKPIIVVVIVKSGNIKTGNMLQSHILSADVSPMEASRTGQDVSICGACTHRGTPTEKPGKKTAENRTCYVNLGQGPNQVFKAYKKGNYPIITAEQTQEIGRGRMVRLGTYGDPAAAPAHVWDNLLKHSVGHTGYTHQHNIAPDYTRLMFSADSAQDAQQAHAKGYRTFRVIPVATYKAQGKAALLTNEILCPASKENDRAVTCTTCKLCSGSDLGQAKTSTGSNSKAKSIAIVAHGTSRNMVI